MKRISMVIVVLMGLLVGISSGQNKSTSQSESEIALTLIPPSLVTDRIACDIRGAIWNRTNTPAKYTAAVYLDSEKPERMLYQESLTVPPESGAVVKFLWPTKDEIGDHEILLIVRTGKKTWRVSQPLTVMSSDVRSSGHIGGAWVGIYHWSEKEGRPWNTQIKMMTDDQWRQLVCGMHRLEMNIIVIQEVFRNQIYNNEDTLIEKNGYQGLAYYPSKLFPGRMPIAAKDPIEDILSEADRLSMHVFLGVGMYAWFDFSRASLEWHERVADELLERYGKHRSFYGWYVSEEKDGSLGDLAEREQIVKFFTEFTPYVHRLAPGKPVMLATNCFHLREAEDTYRKLLPNLDILCPFGFGRMPSDDETGEQAAMLLDTLCEKAGTHLWLDMEAFAFDKGGALIPRAIHGIVSDLRDFTNFEEILCYQYPGLFTAPNASMKLGGKAAVNLYLDYKKYLKESLK